MTNDDETTIRAQRAQSNKAIAERNLDGIVAMMMPDAVVSVAGGPRLSGRDKNRAAFVEQLADPTFVGYVRDTDQIVMADSATHATEQGRWVGRWRLKSRDHFMRGTYTAEWCRVDGAWFIQSEIFVEQSA